MAALATDLALWAWGHQDGTLSPQQSWGTGLFQLTLQTSRPQEQNICSHRDLRLELRPGNAGRPSRACVCLCMLACSAVCRLCACVGRDGTGGGQRRSRASLEGSWEQVSLSPGLDYDVFPCCGGGTRRWCFLRLLRAGCGAGLRRPLGLHPEASALLLPGQAVEEDLRREELFAEGAGCCPLMIW